MGWFGELFSPAKKCARLGHSEGWEYRRGWVPTESYNSVLDRVVHARLACSRCGVGIGEWKEVANSREGFSSVSWPTELWDAYRKDRQRWTDYGWLSEPPQFAEPPR